MPSPDSDLLAALERCAPTLGADVVSLYVFGSRADGRAHAESDVDVAVLLDYARCPARSARFEVRLRLVGRLGHCLGRENVDVVVLNDAPPQFARHIVTHGHRAYCADAAADRAFVRTTLSRAADLEPFLRRARRVKLEAIGR